VTDLWVLVADSHIEATVRTLLDQRRKSLEIRSISYTIMRHVHQDPGCRLQAASLALKFLRDHKHALVVFDKDGCGAENADREQIQSEVQQDMYINGWENRSKVIVIEPELEAWVWSLSTNVGNILGWSEGTEELRRWLRGIGLWPEGAPKPPDPKSAMTRAMRERNRKPSASTFRKLAEKVAFGNCEDPAFQELRSTLKGWFPANGA